MRRDGLLCQGAMITGLAWDAQRLPYSANICGIPGTMLDHLSLHLALFPVMHGLMVLAALVPCVRGPGRRDLATARRLGNLLTGFAGMWAGDAIVTRLELVQTWWPTMIGMAAGMQVGVLACMLACKASRSFAAASRPGPPPCRGGDRAATSTAVMARAG